MGLLVVEVQANSGPISESEKFWQHLFFPLYHHFQLQLECFGGVCLDLFDAPNLPVASVLPWDRWLLSYRQNRVQFLRVKNSGSIYSSPCTTTFNYNQNALEHYLRTYLTH